MSKTTNTRSSIAELISEAKNYYGLQKDFLRYSVAEQLTKLLSVIAITLVLVLVGLVILLFAGMAMVHWIGAAIGNIALCYAAFALFLILLLLVFYLNRRRLVILPLARLMTRIFVKDDTANEDNETDK